VALTNLPPRDQEIVRRCVQAAARGPFFPEWEFRTLFGVDRSVVIAMAEAWPPIDAPDREAQLVINNAFVNLLGYPHGKEPDLVRLVGEDTASIQRVFDSWRAHDTRD
jgi:hypothetical protein